jgi:hypothetical protein
MDLGLNKSIKGMAFVGCSFTWGQGLWYYSYSTSIDQTTDENYGYTPSKYTPAHRAFKDANRYPRLVANYFDTYELVRPRNGGANDNNIEYWTKCFNAEHNPQEHTYVHSSAYDYSKKNYYHMPLGYIKKQNPEWVDRVEKIDKEDISHLIFQFTHWTRNLMSIVYDGKHIEIPVSLVWDKNHPIQEKFLSYLERNNISFDKINNDLISNCILEVKKFLQDCEESGIKTLVVSWPNKQGSSFFDTLRSDTWLNDRLVSFEHNGDTFYSIQDLMDSDQSLCISTDYKNFKIPPTDSHPSLSCHKIIANGVIKKIKEQS